MKLNRFFGMGVLAMWAFVEPAHAQLSQTFRDIFDEILVTDLNLSVGDHANHFRPAAALANEQLTPALNSLIANNVASFPLSSTVPGITFDFSTGQPVRTTESLGPVFAEISETLGARKLKLELTATYLDLDKLRGMRLEDMRFTFTHEDLNEPGLGDDPTEIDVINIFPDLNASANIFVLHATYGVLANLDFGVAVPLVNLSLSGTARAVIEPNTLLSRGGALHFFGGDPLHPELTDEVSYHESAAGIGDVALRLKYRFPVRGALGLASLVDVRLPTGNEKDFLGTGALNVRASLIGSAHVGSFTPHVNLGYDYREAALDSDEIELILGFDQKIVEGLTVAFDFLGEFDISSKDAIHILPGSETIEVRSPLSGASADRVVSLSNVPDSDYDHTLSLALGLRAAPSEQVQFLGNILVPLNNSGLRSTVAPTIGVSIIL